MRPDQRRAFVRNRFGDDLQADDLKTIADGPIMDPGKIYLPAGKVSLAEVVAREGLQIGGSDG